MKDLEKWYLGDTADGKYIFGNLIDDIWTIAGYETKQYSGKVLRIDFEKRIVETADGYFNLGDEHK